MSRTRAARSAAPVALLAALSLTLLAAPSAASAQARFAPPDRRAPPEARPAVTVSLESPQRGVAFHLLTGMSSTASPMLIGNGRGVAIARTETRVYQALCQAPCELALTPGLYVLALSQPGGPPVTAGPFELRGPTRVEGTYVDHSGLRAGGAITLVLGLLGGGVAFGAGLSALSERNLAGEPSNADVGYALIGTGVAAMSVLGLIGLGLGLAGDGARIAF